MQQVLLGKYKVASWGEEDGDILNSRMFETLEEAISFGESLNRPYFLMESLEVGEGTYQWRVLPYGGARLWRTGTFAYRHRMILSMAAIAFLMRMKK